MTQAVSEGTQINNTVIRLTKEDITDLDIEAFVFYAENNLALGSGFGGAIGVRGGPSIQKELDELGPVETCEAIISSAGKLKAEHIVHAVGPKFREENIEQKLRMTMLNTLKVVEEKGIQRIAFPAMGAGYYGIPAPVSAKVMIDVIADHAKGDAGINEVVICLLDSNQYKAFSAALSALK